MVVVASVFMRAGRPNKEVRRGRRGSFRGTCRVISPRYPARMKTTIAINGFSARSIR